jgi:hypothetical protein
MRLPQPPPLHKEVNCFTVLLSIETSRQSNEVPQFSPQPVHNSVLCLFLPLSDAFRGHPEAWTFAAHGDTNQYICGASGNLPDLQAVNFLTAVVPVHKDRKLK